MRITMAQAAGVVLFLLAFCDLRAPGTPKPADRWTVVGYDRMGLAVLRGEVTLFQLDTIFHGWGWKRAKMEALPAVQDGTIRTFEQKLAFYHNWWDAKPLDGRIDLSYRLRKTGPRSLEMTFNCRPDRAMRFAMPRRVEDARATVGPVLLPGRYFEGGSCLLQHADGKTEEFPLPPPRGQSEGISAATFRTRTDEATRVEFDPPVLVHRDMSEVRCWLSSARQVQAGERYAQKMTWTFPQQIAFEPGNRWVDTSDWFPLKVDNDFAEPGVIDMTDCQDAPAGRHGFLLTKGSDFAFADGTPAKSWGVNLINHLVDEKLFDRWAAALAKYGVNLVRMVAFGRPNDKRWAHYIRLQSIRDGLEFDPNNIKLFDYGFAKMRARGIYVGFSPFYGWYPTPADEKRLINHDELMKILRKPFPCQGSFYGVTCIAPDIQNLQIQFHVNLLNHVNSYTGKRYANEPALAFVELQNEENTFLQIFQLEKQLDQCPTYKRLFYRRFADWLTGKASSQEALAKRWGGDLRKDESLAKATVNPFTRWFREPTPRIADQMAFFYDTQRDYYRRFEKAVRATGYKGRLVGSCWQAANWVGHLYNVLSDRDIGHIDRHNYATTDLRNPGVGLLSAGLQAVLDRPFSFSEWHGDYRVGMNLDTPMVAVYGMGLQGWDMSMQFAWAQAGPLPYAHLGINDVCNDFRVLCQYPALARMVRRRDVTQGDVVARREVSIPALKKTADVGFAEQFSLLGGANNKRFSAAVPQEALAAGRVVLAYRDTPADKPVTDGSGPYIDLTAQTVRSTTGELLWDTSGRGLVTVNTPGTKAVIGYGSGRRHELGAVTIAPETPFAHIYVTALGKGETIGTAKRLLVTAMARMVDKGTRFDDFASQPLVRAKAKAGPLLIEPVKATITLKGRRVERVLGLDHDGRLPAQPSVVATQDTYDGARFTLDGRKHRTVYYLVKIK